jgi:hypothetical protein
MRNLAGGEVLEKVVVHDGLLNEGLGSEVVLLHNVAAHNVSIRNVKVSKRERHIRYSITKRTASQNVKCTLRNRYKTFCNSICFVTLYVM